MSQPFRIPDNNEPIAWPIQIPVPVDGGKIEHHRVEDVRFKQISAAEFDNANDRAAALATDEWGTEADPLWDLVEGWPENAFTDPAGNVMPPEEPHKRQLMRYGPTRQAFWQALFQIAVGQEAAEGNSATSPERGPNRRDRRAAASKERKG